MPGIDASIPLSGTQPKAPDLLGQASQAFTLKAAMLSSQQAEQSQRDQQLLRQALSDPSAFDVDPASGVPIPKAETMQKLYSISPQAAQKLGEATQKMRGEQQAQAERAQKLQQGYITQAGPVIGTLASEYEQAAKGGDANVAWAAIAPKVQAANQQFEPLAKAAGVQFKPITNAQDLQLAASHWSKYAERQMRATQPSTPHEVAQETAQKRTAAAAERRASAAEKTAADKAKAAGGFEGDNGQLMAALAERGISLPTGFRSKEQQVALLNGLRKRNPDKSPDEIAEMVKTGQIDLANLKKMGQVAAGLAGKISYAENEIKQTIPLVREASANLPRGKFVPYEKIKQMGEKAFSDPDLAEFAMYMTSLSNAYDMLAARGGTDKDKRAENRRNFDTAPSPEALERVLKAVEKEAAASGRAAQAGMDASAGRKEGGGNTGKPRPPLSSFGGG